MRESTTSGKGPECFLLFCPLWVGWAHWCASAVCWLSEIMPHFQKSVGSVENNTFLLCPPPLQTALPFQSQPILNSEASSMASTISRGKGSSDLATSS